MSPSPVPRLCRAGSLFTGAALLVAPLLLSAGESLDSSFRGYQTTPDGLVAVLSPNHANHFITSSRNLPGLVEWDAVTGSIVDVIPPTQIDVGCVASQMAPIHGSSFLEQGLRQTNALRVFDFATRSTQVFPRTGKLDNKARWMTVDATGTRLFGWRNNAYVLADAQTGKALPGFSSRGLVAVSPAGNRVAIVENETVTVIDLDDHNRKSTWPVLTNVGRVGLTIADVSWSPRGRYLIAYEKLTGAGSSGTGSYVILDVTTGEEVELPDFDGRTVGTRSVSASIAPDDGTMLYYTFSRDRDEGFVLYDLAARKIVSRGTLPVLYTTETVLFTGTHLITFVLDAWQGREAHFATVYDVRHDRMEPVKFLQLSQVNFDLAGEMAKLRTKAQERARTKLEQPVADNRPLPSPGAVFSPEVRETFERFPLLTDGSTWTIDRALLDRLHAAPPLDLARHVPSSDWTRQHLPKTLPADHEVERLPLGRFEAADGSVLLLTLATCDYARPRVRFPFAGSVRIIAQRVIPRRDDTGKVNPVDVGSDLLFDGVLGNEPKLTVSHLDDCILLSRQTTTPQGQPKLEGDAFLKTTAVRNY